MVTVDLSVGESDLLDDVTSFLICSRNSRAMPSFFFIFTALISDGEKVSLAAAVYADSRPIFLKSGSTSHCLGLDDIGLPRIEGQNTVAQSSIVIVELLVQSV